MRQNIIQNIDDPQSNPLQTKTPNLPNIKIKLPHDPKIRLLVFLLLFTFFLMIVALIVSLTRRPTVIPQVAAPTPTKTPQITQSPQNLIPVKYSDKFNQLEDRIKQSGEFLPPSIDQKIGL